MISYIALQRIVLGISIAAIIILSVKYYMEGNMILADENFHDVTVIVDPADYPRVLAELKDKGHTELETRFRLARTLFILSTRNFAKYDFFQSSIIKRGNTNISVDILYLMFAHSSRKSNIKVFICGK